MFRIRHRCPLIIAGPDGVGGRRRVADKQAPGAGAGGLAGHLRPVFRKIDRWAKGFRRW
jgi:hypothetical protein